MNHTFHSSEPKDSELLIFDDTERVYGNGHTSIAGGNDKQGWGSMFLVKEELIQVEILLLEESLKLHQKRLKQKKIY
ncbi:hypothetical protein O2K51_10890 [Apibacter raozihei]|uniref:hypothetical protein n=1 Tax=Apibacter raozihei TaxID=2500547 RepID=UPI000FE36126|nr:hypothetical protein [Apibacter raozihei]